jgi:hypothetical protein
MQQSNREEGKFWTIGLAITSTPAVAPVAIPLAQSAMSLGTTALLPSVISWAALNPEKAEFAVGFAVGLADPNPAGSVNVPGTGDESARAVKRAASEGAERLFKAGAAWSGAAKPAVTVRESLTKAIPYTGEEILQLAAKASEGGAPIRTDLMDIVVVAEKNWPRHLSEVPAYYGDMLGQRSARELVRLEDLFPEGGKATVYLRESAATNADKVVQALAHESFELTMLHRDLKSRALTVAQFASHVMHDRLGNYHALAWEFADQVLRTFQRQGSP